MRFGSVCSGIEAASVAWPFWDAAWFSEIEPFPCAVLKHHYPEVPNHGDMTALPDRILSGEVEAPDVFCGGTPCQAFSVAGNRKSLDDARGNLSLTFCEIADAIDSVRYVRGSEPAIIFWENVPGVLNTTDNAFGCFLGKLAGEHCELQPPGGRWTDAGVVHGPKRAIAWRVLDAQYFGLAQRRKRVFVVASAREGFNPAAVLFEFDGVRRDTPPSGEARQAVAGDAEARVGGGMWPADLACTLNAAFGSKQGLEDQHINGGAPLFVPHPVCAEISPTVTNGPPFSRTGNERVECDELVVSPPRVFKIRGGCDDGGKGYLGMDEQVFTITTGHDQQVAVPIAWDEELNAKENKAGTLLRGGQGGRHDGVAVPMVNMQGSKGNAVATATPVSGWYEVKCNHCGERFDTKTGLPHVCEWCGYKNELVAFHAEAQSDQLPNAGKDTGVSDALTCSQHAAVATQYAVRRLTPTECERLQGFPPVIEITRLIGCIDHQSKTVRVEMQCHRLQSSAWNAVESEYLQFANAAAQSSATVQAGRGKHVALYARGNFAELTLALIKKQNEKNLNADNAEKQSWSRSHIQDESFVASLAPHLESLAKIARNGRAELHQSTLLSSTAQSGRQSVGTSGAEIEGIAGDVVSDAKEGRSTISLLGHVTPTCDSPIPTSLCSVIRATSSFIQDETQCTNFCIDLVLERDYTNIPWRNKPEAPDGPRYKALGNSWAVPVVRWIGERINSYYENR